MTALKIWMVIYGILTAAFGAFLLIDPGQFIDVMGLGTTLSDTAAVYMGAAGVAWIAVGAWAIYAVRELAQNIIYVKFLITLELLNAAGIGYTAVAGHASFGDMVLPFVMACVFAALFLVLYPWRAGRKKPAER